MGLWHGIGVSHNILLNDNDVVGLFGVLFAGWRERIALDAAGGEQQENKDYSHAIFSFQLLICSRTRSGAVPP